MLRNVQCASESVSLWVQALLVLVVVGPRHFGCEQYNAVHCHKTRYERYGQVASVINHPGEVTLTGHPPTANQYIFEFNQ